MSKYCTKCGKQLEDEALFCIVCGAKQTGEILKDKGKNDNNRDASAVSFFGKAALFLGGLIMTLLTLPGYIWFEANRLGGLVKSMLSYDESVVNNKAEIAKTILEYSGYLGLIILAFGIVLYILEAKKFFQESKIRSVCLFLIPVIVGVIVASCCYPFIFKFAITFAYLMV